MSRQHKNMSEISNLSDQNSELAARNNAAGIPSPVAKTAAPASALLDIGLHEKITAINLNTVGIELSAGHSPVNGAATYPIDKLDAHLQNIPHLAISIFVFCEERLLLQQRAATKYHSAGLWANTVCSHPRWQETAASCAQRRIQEELGWTTSLTAGEQIDYHAQVGELYENEQVHCFFGTLQHEPAADTSIEKLFSLLNPDEVSNLRWMTMHEIDTALHTTPEIFSAWFKIYMSKHRDKLQRMMEASINLHQAFKA